ncbi:MULTISPECIES: thiamine pyrophosphate-binding protein [Dethiosulfovibrio]|uniref:Thiamine pyrophosphate-binding protein n=2 Tax=Dethiosulfovibrio TaxID=47054 RepID=A0ABS9EPC1_9BACT|nr:MULTISPECIES: thiamine pyrophosphate-binding protein [Dethiosulfovibrio]MCF4113924.1 thiamine pyrophosphate-binding protein [Dethiosulfovibrio russensis]MCF4141663.1 thiamine pyrophosphate-binding protein [Dethiosulfovibrio marinus]MCF4143920.1 thiamine pyrophosphate-binding protein [Dethiosulfovibrio acidaminovorans]
MKASDWIARYLADIGVDTVFEMIGGMTTHMLDSIYREGRSRIVTVHHEQAGAIAACGWAQVKGLPGVALATSGPGAVNLLTGIGTCYFDSIPAVFLTGQVNRNELSTGLSMRQLGFQETDVVSMAKAVTKGAVQVTDPEDIPKIMDWAFKTAMEGRPGPVLIDIPMDVQRGEITEPYDAPELTEDPDKGSICGADRFLDRLKNALDKANRPLILVGSGVVRSGISEEVSSLVRKLKVPSVFSLMGKGTLKDCGELSVGMIGTYGNRWANYALARCDLLLVLGSRLDIRQTGVDTEGFTRQKEVFQVDIDPCEIEGRITATESLVADLRSLVPLMADKIMPAPSFDDWRSEISERRRLWDDTEELGRIEGINPNGFMRMLGLRSPDASAFVTDIGANQMWAAQSLDTDGRPFISSGGMGAMGYALPAAMGASIGFGQTPVVVVVGDGGMQCNIQELQTIVRNKLPLKIVVMDNGSLGMVRQFQEAYMGGRYPGTVWGYDAPDFCRVAEAYGIEARRVEDPAFVEDALAWLWRDPEKPSLLSVRILPGVGVAPKMAFGKGLDEMEPER